MKLSVFRGGFDREAAQEVTGSSPATLTALVDHAFVRMNASGRYDIHELLRQFAREKLEANPESREQVRDRHGDYYTSFVEQREERVRAQRSNLAVMEILEEIDNVRAAWFWATEGHKVGQIRKSLRCFAEFYEIQNWYSEGVSALERVVEMLPTEPLSREKAALRGLALTALAHLSRHMGRHKRARVLLEEALSILRSLDAPLELALAVDRLGQVAFNEGSYEEAHRLGLELLAISKEAGDVASMAAATWLLSLVLRVFGQYRASMRLKREAISYSRRIDRQLGLGQILSDLGDVAQILGEYEAAISCIEEGLVYLIALDFSWSIGHAYEALGRVNHALGEFEVAERNLGKSLAIAREVGDPRRITFALVALGDLAVSSGQFEEARGYFTDALELSIANSQRWQEAWSLLGLGKTSYGEGDYSGASQYLEESLALCRELGWKLGVARTHVALGEVAVATADDEAARRSFRRALEIGLEIEVNPLLLGAMSGAGRLLAQGGELTWSVELLALALDHPASHAETKNAAAGALDEIESQLPQAVFKASVQKGKGLDLERTATGLIAFLEAAPSAPGDQPLVEPLTERELEVLGLVAAGQSNREIAQELVIALGTVKTHVHNICGKLNAPNRVKAAARARELGLL
jgi:ATP/maltotriose-dependent transcriptional regulator MalT